MSIIGANIPLFLMGRGPKSPIILIKKMFSYIMLRFYFYFKRIRPGRSFYANTSTMSSKSMFSKLYFFTLSLLNVEKRAQIWIGGLALIWMVKAPPPQFFLPMMSISSYTSIHGFVDKCYTTIFKSFVRM